MDVIFVKLPKYLDPVGILIRKLGHRVFYLELSTGYTKDTENRRVAKLKELDIVPLPIEELPRVRGFLKDSSDLNKELLEKAKQTVPTKMMQAFEKLFPNITNLTEKVQVNVFSIVAIHIINITLKVNIWTDAYPNRKVILINISPYGILTSGLAPNVRLVVLPLELFTKVLDTFIKIFHRFLLLSISKFKTKGVSQSSIESHYQFTSTSKVALVTHQGLDYGNLYKKDLFYSDQINSNLHPQKLLYIDYSGWTSPSEKINWVCLGNHRQSWIKNISFAFVAICTGILHIRHFRQILGLFILTRFFVIFRSYSTQLEAYPDLKIALIDYELLCPNELSLALESKGIQTVATQERFIFAFYKLYAPIILNNYLCSSHFAAEAFKKARLTYIDSYIPIGQSRSDILFKAKNSPPPQIIKAPLAKGLRIITALGFHTHTEWQNSQPDILLNWKAHQHFLDDMIRLSCEIPYIFIVIRYKGVDWISLPIFAETIQKIKSSDNITISTDYETFNISYDLCAHSDLVIAKHTSLADECLSVGIPVLFHEYTHNTERLIADFFDYRPAKIMCFNYQELKYRVQIILSGTPNAMTEDYKYLKNVVYGGLGDGRVKERIHAHIEEMLSEM